MTGVGAGSRRSLLRPVLSVVYIVAVVVFAVVLLRNDWNSIVDHASSAGIQSILLALVFSVGGLLASALSFRALLAGLGHRLPLAGTFRIYFVSQLGKYLPGSVWPALAQLRLGADYGVANQANLASFFIGLLLSIAVGGTTGFVVLASIEPRTWLAPALLCIAGLAAGLALLPKWAAVRNKLPSVLQRRLPEQPPDRQSLLTSIGFLVVSWVLHGLQVAVLSDALGVELDSQTLRSIGAFALAYAGGVLFVIAPAGAGVREALMASVLGSANLALIAAVVLLSRVVLLVADVGLGLLGAAVASRTGVSERAPTDFEQTNVRDPR